MPTVNIYAGSGDEQPRLAAAVPAIKRHVAEALTCGDITLTPDEVSVRIVVVARGSGMIGNIEADVVAHAFEDRVRRSDAIALAFASFLETVTDRPVKAWLSLTELGHSWS